MKTIALLGLLVAASVKIFLPQNVDTSKPVSAFPSELQKYLDLSDDQVARILRLNREHDEMAYSPQVRLQRGQPLGRGLPGDFLPILPVLVRWLGHGQAQLARHVVIFLGPLPLRSAPG